MSSSWLSIWNADYYQSVVVMCDAIGLTSFAKRCEAARSTASLLFDPGTALRKLKRPLGHLGWSSGAMLFFVGAGTLQVDAVLLLMQMLVLFCALLLSSTIALHRLVLDSFFCHGR